MKRKENFVLRQVVDTWIVLPLGEETANFDGMLSLNESGAMLWNILKQETTREELAMELTKEYNISYQKALTDVDDFLKRLIQLGCLEI